MHNMNLQSAMMPEWEFKKTYQRYSNGLKRQLDKITQNLNSYWENAIIWEEVFHKMKKGGGIFQKSRKSRTGGCTI